MTQTEAKELVGKRAVDFVQDGMALGLGTGSTATMFIRALGEKVKQGLRVRCVASSDASHDLAVQLGIPMTNFTDTPELDLAIDGADEVGPGLTLIKGGGGAMLREKIVISAAKQYIVVVDSTKVVKQLGKFPLPVEVIEMALPIVQRKLAELGLNPSQRHHPDGSVYITDEGNFILDCACREIADAARTAEDVRHIVGVVEHGLFLNMATLALVAGENGVEELHR